MTLASCSFDYWRELKLRMTYHNVPPPWEDAHGGAHGVFAGNYSWAFTQFHAGLNTADPAEAGLITTTPATYTGYSMATYNRGVAYWTLGGAGGSTPSMKGTNGITWPEKSSAGTQDQNAVSLAMLYSATDYSLARDALGAAVTIHQFERPTIASLALTIEAL